MKNFILITDVVVMTFDLQQRVRLMVTGYGHPTSRMLVIIALIFPVDQYLNDLFEMY